jgi:hypothetical protein
MCSYNRPVTDVISFLARQRALAPGRPSSPIRLTPHQIDRLCFIADANTGSIGTNEPMYSGFVDIAAAAIVKSHPAHLLSVFTVAIHRDEAHQSLCENDDKTNVCEVLRTSSQALVWLRVTALPQCG